MNHRIVVLGAGYSGVHAAGRLARRLHADITLVDAQPEFTERIRLHQLATGQELRPRPLRDVLAGTRVTPRTGTVAAVDADRRTVTLAGGDTIRYDTLVYALGSTAGDQGVPGVDAHAYHVAGRAAALRLRDRLRALGAGDAVLVVGGGLTGIESATEIAESRPDLRVTLAARGRAGGLLGARAQRHLRDVLARLGVTVLDHTEIARVGPDGVVTGDGAHVPAAVTVWTAGFAVHPIAAASTLTVSGAGRIVVDGSMRSVSHPDVYAVGDAAHALGANGEPLRMACGSGIPMAWQAADAIAARLTGGRVRERPIRFYAQCISLGRHDGIVQFVDGDDRPTSSVLTGGAAARVKEFVCAGAAWSIGHPTLLLPMRRRRVSAVPAPVAEGVGR
ncbi:NAD(P)/FAD-dependent oxidoreductase [Catenuloplanes atrovinosus]|uniref:NADH dehydrogenase FAD-containing subunit n=1 Tax=Catenuloplanes atrovinosus TaxID=137266 RepID=A0AAE3YP24_9ACTN|nr:FAD-dependent oxidoreductase [Catenuloplanes atrovinosus]MDR7276562.1 NADH dehydrogenase FAD-containing subunit [Catenuloplanes atrovinosus]